ncbi:hypothetical protein [Herbaspirillum rubrisubalbicans]|uniref:Uncharacterized protein n=1 Tax=Herbaspirillum rubrisubalbicans Os34 TaxID=1235827 RepID=A0A6M3ZX21_9BURK|nr:hypothetical protein [Herbaspirillum rubrisubalbicans]QJQ02763.1 hypothetical protein C798_21805 [Herbaspirillum rubrisubalbicans Os34]
MKMLTDPRTRNIEDKCRTKCQPCLTRSLISRTTVMLIGLMLPLLSLAGELPKVREDYLARYRSMAKYERPMMKYVLIRADSREAYISETVPTIYLLDIKTKSQNKVFYSPEIDQLIKEELVLEIHHQSLLSHGKTDYVVMSMYRPAAIDPDYTRCWDRSEVQNAYLFSITDGKVKIISKSFGGCGTYYEVIKEGKTVGYRVTTEDYDGTSTTERYALRGGSLVKQPERQKKEVSP